VAIHTDDMIGAREDHTAATGLARGLEYVVSSLDVVFLYVWPRGARQHSCGQVDDCSALIECAPQRLEIPDIDLQLSASAINPNDLVLVREILTQRSADRPVRARYCDALHAREYNAARKR
jgi:hypothetical protein